MTMPFSEKKMKQLLTNYFEEYNVTNLQKDSYEDFLNNRIYDIIREENKIEVNFTKTEKYTVLFRDPIIEKPHIIEEDRTIRSFYPAEARARDLTYDAPICINIEEIFSKLVDDQYVVSDHNIHNKVIITRIPIMLQTSRCNLYGLTKDKIEHAGEDIWDYGGYFIIKGKERVLVSQERINYNSIYVFEQKSNSKFKYISEIRSMSEVTSHSVLVQAKIENNDKNITFSLPYITQDIPVGIVFKAMGIIDNDEIHKLINVQEPELEKYLNNIIYKSFHITTKEEALNYIGKYTMHTVHSEKRIGYVEQIFENELFPHMGIISTEKERCMFLGFMIKKLILTASGIRVPDDRDHLSNKRNETAGILVSELFRTLYKRFIRSLQPQLQKRQDIMIAISRYNTITHGIKHCFSTGNWGVQKNSYIRMGVSQILCRLTYGATISHLRRLVIPIGKEGKNTKIRQLHNSQIGFICPAETPEGHSAGIVKNFTLVTKISNHIPSVIIKEIISKVDGIQFLNNIEIISNNLYKILINGFWIGSTENPDMIINDLRQKRDRNILHKSISISYNDIDNEINIFSDAGRILRPLIVVEDNKLLIDDSMNMNWDELIEKNIIRYIDSYEVDNCVIAMNEKELSHPHYKYNYCEIHPSLIIGICASIIPFPDHTQSPRNTYQSAMGKQAIGTYAVSNDIRTDTVVHTLQYTQKPVVHTHISDCIGFNKMASGINCIVAIGCYSGFNQEDSVILNRGAVDKGLFRSFVFRTISATERKRSANYFEHISLPDPNIRMKAYNYQKLDENGIVRIGEYVEKNDIVIGRVITKTKHEKNNKTDSSISVKHGEEGIVDKVYISKTPDGYTLIKVKIRSQRIPEIGDKFASREAQKGTCGMIFNQEDMPFTDEGLTPDIIINPHCIPSRMTINQLLECVGAKSSIMNMKFRDCTAFSESSVNIIETMQKELEAHGYQNNGYETMTSGFTGEQMTAKIFIGPVYYQRLKHLVKDKIHARDNGNVQSLTRQPLEGRSREGGLRFGEMERDCIICHGSSQFLLSRLFLMSDPYQIHVCKQCGQIPSSTELCNICGCDKIELTNIPYACKLLFQELNAIGLKLMIKTK